MRRRTAKLFPLRVLCAALALVAMCSRTLVGAATTAGQGDVRRVNHGLERSHNTNAPANDQLQRRVEDENVDDNAPEEDERDEWEVDGDDRYNTDDVIAWQVEYTPYDKPANSTLDVIVSTVQNYAANAESTAWSFYENPPSEWTKTQWDLIFFMALGIVAACCLGAACCAYSCAGKNQQDADTGRQWSPRQWRPSRRGKKGNARKNQKKEVAEDLYEQYRKGGEGDGGISDDGSLTVSSASGHEVPPCYTPPTPQSPSSLADYTSIQREKEARNWAVWRALQEEKDREAQEASREEIEEDIEDEDTARHCNRRGTRGGRTLQSVAELDAALERAEDRLLEARERQHNLVGYYL